jgi:urease accessory protein
MEPNTLSLLQLCDSNFPTGAFSHSYGLETYIQENTVFDEDTFSNWIKLYLNGQLIYTDGLACHLAYEALKDNDLERIWHLDRMLMAQNLPRETREGTQKISERMLQLTETLFKIEILSVYMERVKKKESYGHPALVFTMVAYHLGISQSTTLQYYLYSTISSLVQNAVRAIPLGQTAGQRILHELNQSLEKVVHKIQILDIDDFGIAPPGLELSQMKHERVTIRLFMS